MVEDALIQKKISGLMILCFENERPFQGMIAKLDWRFDGHFTKLMQSQILTGKKGDFIYAPLKWNDETYHFLLMGAGPVSGNGARPNLSENLLSETMKHAERLKLSSLGISKQDWNLGESSVKHLEERKICILN